MKCVAYMRGGSGDVYPFLAILPQIMKEHNLNMDDIVLYLDSVYTLNPTSHKFASETMLRMIDVAGLKNIIYVPIDNSSAMDLLWPSQNARIYGPLMEENFDKKEFMFWKELRTREFIRSKLTKDTIFIDGVVDTNFEWDMKKEEYKQLDYEEVPLEFKPDVSEMIKINDMLKSSHLLIHYRKKGYKEDTYYYNKIIEFCSANNITPIVIGLKDDNLIGRFIDLREELSVDGLFYITKESKMMLTSSSIFTFHRLYYNFKNKTTIISYPNHLGGFEKSLKQKIYDNPNHYFYNSDEDNIDKICEVIKNEN